MERTKYNFPEIKIVSTKVIPTKNGIRLTLDLSVDSKRNLTANCSAECFTATHYFNKNNFKNNTLLASKKNKLTKTKPINIKERTKKFLPLANQLAKTILSKRNMKLPPSQINQWADEIRKLSEMSNVDYVRIEKALDWYEDNIGGEFIPVVNSGYALRKKFDSLENAIEREKNLYSNGKPKSKFIGGRKYDLCPDGQYRNIHGELYIE